MREYRINYLERVTDPDTGDLVFVNKSADVTADSVVQAINQQFAIEAEHWQDMLRLMMGSVSEIINIT